MNNHVFTRKIPSQAKLLCLLTVIPLYFFGGSLIGNAVLKFVLITFSLDLEITTMNAYLNFFVDLAMAIYVVWVLKDSLIEQWCDFKKDMKGHIIYG